MKQLFIMLVLDGGCRVAVAFYGEEVTQLLLDKRSETTEPHCAIQLHSIHYHCVDQVDTMSYHRYTVR